MYTKREAAHAAARRGFDVFPITPNDKKPPLLSDWQNKATQDPKQIDAWWDAYPDANIGGITENFVVVDIDPRNGANATMLTLLDLQTFPNTVRNATAGGGDHLIYAADRPVKGGVNKLGPGVDIKARGGYIVLPGSTINGASYKWLNDREIARAPQWLIDQCKTATPRNDAAGKRIVEEDETAVEMATKWMLEHAPSAEYGAIDDTTFIVAARLYDFGCSLETVIEIVSEWNEIKCHPPGDAERLLTVCESAGRNRENAIGSKHPNAAPFDAIEIDETKAPQPAKEPVIPAGDLIKSSAEFIKGFVPPEYLIDGMLQRRFCYSMTAKTGVGKTAVAMLLASHVEAGRQLDGLDVAKGPVLYFAGENPTDIQMRWLGLTQETKTNPETANVHFVPGVVPLSKVATRIAAEVAAKGLRPALVVVDTSAAYFEGDDENSNTQAVEHARRMRALTELPGGPCVLILCHPTKRANDDDMIPRGGGAFLAEVDGNIALHQKDSAIIASAQGKFRGPEFTPLSFALKTVQHPILVDAKGRPIPTVVARTIGEAEKQRMETTSIGAENSLLKAVHDRPDASFRQLAEALGWRYKTGKPDHSKVGRGIDKLVKSKLLQSEGRGWRVTAAGDKELARPDPFFETEEGCRTVATRPPGFDPKTEV